MVKVVLGGGIGGLSAAYFLRKRFPAEKITLIEASSRTGGWIRSERHEDGFIFERGPRTIRPQGVKGANTLELIEELGLESQIVAIPSHHHAARNRMVYVNGQLHSLPSTFWSVFRTKEPFSKPLIRYLYNDLISPAKCIADNDESIYDFVERRFGREIADYAISPLICGICAGDAKSISVKFLMENLFNNEQKYGSISKGILFNIFNRTQKNVYPRSSLFHKAKRERWSIYSFRDGLETLPKRLVQVNQQNNVETLLNSHCTSIEIGENVKLDTSAGSFTAEHLISCVPAKILGNLLNGHDELVRLLKTIKPVNVCVVNLHYQSNIINKNGFGFLVPPSENKPVLGVIFDSCCFPHNDDTILTVMMGGHWFEKYFGSNPTEEHLLDVALIQLKEILGISQKPRSYKVNILLDCIPQYVVGHNNRVNQITEYIKSKKLPLSLCGSSYKGVGINDVIISAKEEVEALHM